jgi:hypothetical protein
VALLNVARSVILNGQSTALNGIKLAYPTQKYKTDIALSRLLQMPLVCIKPYTQNIWLSFENVEGVDPIKFLSLANALFSTNQAGPSLPSVSKSGLS